MLNIQLCIDYRHRSELKLKKNFFLFVKVFNLKKVGI